MSKRKYGPRAAYKRTYTPFWETRLEAGPPPLGYTKFDLQVDRVATVFSRRLWLMFSERIMLDIIATNRERNNASCATHDHCDANMVMSAALEEVLGLTEDEVLEEMRGDLSRARALWSSGWSLAKDRAFEIPRELTIVFKYKPMGAMLEIVVRGAERGWVHDDVSEQWGPDDQIIPLADWTAAPYLGDDPYKKTDIRQVDTRIPCDARTAQEILVALDQHLIENS